MRNHGIIAYGTPDDRLRLAALSATLNKSGSQLIVDYIRERYKQVFGDLDPGAVAKK